MYSKIIKQLLDFSFSLIGFLILLPIFIIIFIVLTINSLGNPFFFQNRPGKNGKLFKVIKFKTMNNKKDKCGNFLPDEIRLTVLGKFIRKTSLDEIPQLINVLKGDMSLIGPRPLLPEYLPLYNENQKKRHNVKPGITGWAQVNGRNAISWGRKFELDVWYVQNLSFLLDLKILLKTVGKVLKTEGINREGEVTTTRFKGNDE